MNIEQDRKREGDVWKEKQREYSLDVIKIIATVIIIFHHYQYVTGAKFEQGINFLDGKFYFGYVVELFFVLSGYFMYPYIDKIKSGKIKFHVFFLKRWFRFAPLVTLSAITFEIFLVCYRHLYQVPWMDINTTFWGTVLSSVLMQAGWGFSNHCVNDPIWYISVLMLCSVIFYGLVYIAKRKNIPVIYLFIIMILIGVSIDTYGINLPFLTTSSSRGYYAFFSGIILAWILQNNAISIKAEIISILIVLGIPLLIIYHNDFMSAGINYTMTFIYYPALIVVFKSRILSVLCNWRIIGVLGKISFDVYVWHNPFYILLYIVIKVFHWNLDLLSVKTMVCYAIFCFLFGTFSHFCIEKPLASHFGEIEKGISWLSIDE